MQTTITPAEADILAWRERRDYEVYRALEANERNPEFREILHGLIAQERSDYDFWLRFTSKKDFSVSPLLISMYVLMRQIFGLVFTAKFLERREKEAAETYMSILDRVDDDSKAEFERMIAHEREHERKFIASIREERLDFVGNIVLGINDGLIELTGALVGFSFALSDTKLVATTGLITGIAATLSMASSAYMQAKYDNEKNPFQAALYTGGSYLAVVALLITPFFLLSSIPALVTMGFVVLGIIAVVTLYGSVVFDRSFAREFTQMIAISIGVSFITFLLGLVFRTAFGVSI